MIYNVVRPDGPGRTFTEVVLDSLRTDLVRDGWAVLRGFDVDMTRFSDLVATLCQRMTFDPAREYTSENTQKVDAGRGPIGLHVENGNTPRCPDIVAFFARRGAFEGSQTTVCDGQRLYDSFGDTLRRRWSQPMTVIRTLPERLWKSYLAHEHPAISHPDEVRMEHVLEFARAVPGQDFTLNEDGSMLYALTLDPVRPSALGGGLGFANAVLGPSHNYEPPRYRMADGSEVSTDEIEALRERAEDFTIEINWQDGDVAVLDNTRVMHGRRAIKDPDRELFIGMGML